MNWFRSTSNYVLFPALTGLAITLGTLSVQAQISPLKVDGSMTPEDLVRKVLLGPGVQVTNIKYTGSAIQRGKFTVDSSLVITNDLAFWEGIILSSGNITNAPGPNLLSNASTNCGQPGDADLNGYAGRNTQDAAVLEFDFVPATDTVRFNYVFASEEYPEYVGSNYNDVFAFLINGPGIFGKKNVAIIPGTTTPISINTVNHITNSQYYEDNTLGLQLQYDGFTVGLAAILRVIPCQTYHIKLAVADGSDQIFDSAVFLEANSFVSPNAVYLDVTFDDPVEKFAVEGCTNGTISIVRTKSLDQELGIKLEVGGTAVNGVDYVMIPDSITMAIGQTKLDIPIIPILDTDSEGEETMYIKFRKDFKTCFTDSIGMTIKDQNPMFSAISNDTLVCEGEMVLISSSASGGAGNFKYKWSTGDTTQGLLVTAASTQTYTVEITDKCGAKKSESMDLNVEQKPDSILVSCAGEGLDFLKWSWTSAGATSGYEIRRDDQPNWVSVGNTLNTQISNLAQGDTVGIWVRPLGKAPCADGDSSYRACVTQKINNEYWFQVPTAFSPNGDGENEFFRGLGQQFSDYSMEIYNRWGERIYRTENYDNPWMGYKQDTKDPAPDGVYLYTISVRKPDNTVERFYGTVTLTR